jgi:Papain-like cysteine protease AvrRpt2/Glutathione S-transferase, N-terminal domain
MKHYFSRNLNPRLAVAVARVLNSPVEFEFASPFSPEQREKFLKLNPNLSVPILVEGDKTLWEADAIACRLSQLANLTSGLWAIPFLTSSAGLPIEANRQLAADAGMVAEPLVNPSIEGWRTLLRENGLLWTSYGWQAMSPDGMTVQRAGRLIIIFYGIEGDGSSGGTQIRYVDPSDGGFHTMSVDHMVQQHETGFTMQWLTDSQLGQFSQIIHY